jgi:hypothetical protein
VRLSGSGWTGKGEGCRSTVSNYGSRRAHLLLANRIAPRAPRKTSTTPASPRSNGTQRTGRSGIHKMSAPTNARDPARIFDDQWDAEGSRRTQARQLQYTKTIPTTIKANGRAGNPTRPETASNIRSAPSSRTINSFKSWKSFADVGTLYPRQIAQSSDIMPRPYTPHGRTLRRCAAMALRTWNDTIKLFACRIGD